MTVPAAAIALGITSDGVIALIRRGKLSAVKFGRDWAIDAQSVAEYQLNRRPAGRPKKG